MSYESSPHTTQIAILRHLLFVPEANFAALQKDSDLTSDHFTFHIKKLVESGYVIKTATGYQLSPIGKEYANRMDTDENEIEKQPKISVVAVLERNKDGRREFIAQQRLKQPYYGFWGRLGGKVRWGESFEAAAKRELKEETGFDVNVDCLISVEINGSGWYRFCYACTIIGKIVINTNRFRARFKVFSHIAQWIKKLTVRSGKLSKVEADKFDPIWSSNF